MRRGTTASAAAAWLLSSAVLLPASASPADGTWLLPGKVAIQIMECDAALCGRLVWLHNPSLRTPELCGRTIVWGLTPAGPLQWSGGWIFDPEDRTTYNLAATLEGTDTLTARIYESIEILGETKILNRIEPGSLPGWC
jgi:uncharacterized protein (DUF2147 family)